MKKSENEEAKKVQTVIINDRLAQLSSKDYIGTKIAMGVATREEYSEEIAQTEQWRNELNAARQELARLEAITEFDDDIQEKEA